MAKIKETPIVDGEEKEVVKPTTRKSTRGAITEAKSTSVVPLQPTEAEKFPIGQLVSVSASFRKTTDDGAKPVLVFHFADGAKERQHYHTEWCLLKDSDKFTIAEQITWQNDFIAHIWDTFMGVGSHAKAQLGAMTDEYFNAIEIPEEISETEDEEDLAARVDWYAFFYRVADQFNTGRAGKPIYQTTKDGKAVPVVVRIKLILDNKGDYYQLPKFGNFLELWVAGKPTLLQLGKKDRITKAPAANYSQYTNPAANPASNPAQDDLPAGF